MPTVKFYENVEACYHDIDHNRITFKDTNNEMIASYPSQYTIIEEIINN